MAIHHAFKIINKDFPNEPAHIFIDYFKGLYVIKNQLNHPTLHNNHPDKTNLEEIVNFLIQRTQPTTLYKVRTHANITRNKEADTLPKEHRSKEHSNASQPHENLPTQHRTTTKETIGYQWEQPLTKDPLDSLKKISQNI